MQIIADYKEREQALNPNASFIVQAPAGSGKTELLVQRFLTLLATAKYPEEIIAITFTRKAATEMRLRILAALEKAANNIEIKSSHEEKTQHLAHAALLNNQKSSWNLLNNPNRLQILTIDSLCLSLTRKMPLLSHFGAMPDIIEDATDYYRQAAQKFLKSLETEQTWSKALQLLLLHLDNNYMQAEKLFVTMLAHRDQWLPHILSAKNQQELRQILESGLQNIVLENLNKCYQAFPKELQSELLELLIYAANNLKNHTKKSIISSSYNLSEFPSAELNNFQHWYNIANLLLTNEFSWRKRIDVNLGFPVTNKSMKQRLERLLNEIAPLQPLQQALKNVLESPAPKYHEDQWQVVNVLVELLPVLAAQLTVIFRQHAKVDFIEISSSATRALVESGFPSDLALHLDYKIQHILVDEFQDTSLTQFQLLELLTSGWHTNDGHTLFLVGDPMQSIYRFRQAEVGLFLRAKNVGIGNVKLIPLNLSVNFRADANIISWLNETFDNLFPKEEDIATGAVSYSLSVAATTSLKQSLVNIFPFSDTSTKPQAECIASIITTIKKNNPNETIAILVRSRTYLQEIILALKNAKLKFRGVEIEKLSEHSVVQDLFALTRALLHLGDKVAWLAILRAPWCGLTLTDLYFLANENKKSALWNVLINYQKVSQISADGQFRLARILPILNFSLQNRQRQNLRIWIEATWRALGGAACCQTEIELDYAKNYFDLLESSPANENDEDLVWLEQILQITYAPPDHLSDDKLQIMTIHKAKGLEFDHVILPCLESKTIVDENRLLMWLERPRAETGSDLILAPIKSSFAEQDSIYDYLRLQEAKKTDYETIRLLYVAMTRAKKNLYLLGNIKIDTKTNELVKPFTNTFLGLLWPVVEKNFLECLSTMQNTAEIFTINLPQTIRRLTKDWQSPLISNENVNSQLENQKRTALEFSKSYDPTAQAIGIIIHRTLQKITQESLLNWDAKKIQSYNQLWQKQLLKLGVGLQEIGKAVTEIEKAILRTLNDERGKWLLTQHQQAQSELPLTITQNGKIIHLIIDRTFIYNNIRWVVDYKTAQPKYNENIEAFLASQQQLYLEQLTLYAQAIGNQKQLPIRLGLYFPLFGGWIEFDNFFQDLYAN